MLQETGKAFRGPCPVAAVLTTAGPSSLLRYHHSVKSIGTCGVAVHDLIENVLFLKKKTPCPNSFSFGSPEYEIGFCNKTVFVSFLFYDLTIIQKGKLA